MNCVILNYVRDFKTMLKSQISRLPSGLCCDAPKEYPKLAESFKLSHPLLYRSAYMEAEPVVSDISPDVWAQVISKVRTCKFSMHPNFKPGRWLSNEVAKSGSGGPDR